MNKHILLAVAALRGALGIIAIPLAPALFEDHFLLLVVLRPTKEVLLAGGFLWREGDVFMPLMVLAALPLALFGVWLFFALGRAWGDDLQDGSALPKWGRRVLPPKRVKALCRVLDKRGRSVVVLGRLAAFPSTMLAAAAGASDMKPREFLPADALGAFLSMAEVIAAGYLLGEAYKLAGPWLTGAGVVVGAVVLVLLGRWLRNESGPGSSSSRAGT